MHEHVRALIVGTGFSGLAASITLQELGIEHLGFERGDDIGGTWRDNTYPAAVATCRRRSTRAAVDQPNVSLIPEGLTTVGPAGPNTGIGHTSLVVVIEAQVRYIAQALQEMDRRGAATVEVRHGAYDAYSQDVQRRMQRTVWSIGGCQSWYMDDKGRNPTLWPDFTFTFLQKTRRFDAESYAFESAVRARGAA